MTQQNSIQGWLDQTNDVDQISTAMSKLVTKIDQLPSHQKDDVYSRLRNDARFESFNRNFQPQTA